MRNIMCFVFFIFLSCGLTAQINTRLIALGAGSAAGTSQISLQSQGGDVNYLATGDDGDFVLYSNGGTESMRISDNTFEVNFLGARNMFATGTSNADYMAIQHSSAFPTYGLQYQDDIDAFNFIGAGASKLFISLGGGDVGIGTETPTQKLEVVAPGTSGIRVVGNDTGDSRVSIFNGGNNHFLFDDDSDGHNLKLQSGANVLALLVGGASEAARVSNFTTATAVDNNMTVGTTGFSGTQLYVDENKSTTGALYAIIGDAGVGGASGARYGVRGSATGTSGNRYGVYGNGGTATGQWGGYFSGNLYYTGSFTSTSDARLKKNIKSTNLYGLDEVMQMQPKSYEFKTTEVHKELHLAEGVQMGFLAQDLETIMPELVSTDNHIFYDNPGEDNSTFTEMEIKSVKYLEIIPVLTKAIQDQQAIIQALTARIDELEKQ